MEKQYKLREMIVRYSIGKGGTVYAIVNDGHGRTGVSLNLTNADYIVW